MTRTAIVPVPAKQVYPSEGDDRWLRGYQCGYADGWNELVGNIEARPAVPDELIEEAAKAIFDVAAFPECRWETSDSGVHDYYRNMARAAARVFNGGKDE